jgi:hypothetical protein
MAATDNSCVGLVYILDSSLKPLCQMNRNMIAIIYGGFSINIVHLFPMH